MRSGEYNVSTIVMADMEASQALLQECNLPLPPSEPLSTNKREMGTWGFYMLLLPSSLGFRIVVFQGFRGFRGGHLLSYLTGFRSAVSYGLVPGA